VEAPPSPARVEAETVGEALRDAASASALLEEAAGPDRRLATARDVEYLRWRYGSLFDYRAVREERAGRLCGVAIFRVLHRGRLRESRVAELIVPPGDTRTARQLLHGVLHASPVDHLTCQFARRSVAARAAGRSGFLRSPRSVNLMTYPLRDDIVPDPTDLRSWALALGDMEELL
jgi:hypothetical protein